MTPAEKAKAWSENGPEKSIVEQGYPLLRSAAERLRGEGVHVFDASDVFDAVQESVYTDACCHFNAPAPNAVLAKRIAREILQAWSP
jgi:hypothetical protein